MAVFAAELEAARARFGVVRVTSLTALDRIGVSVAGVTRADPFPGSNSVCSAAGETEEEARVAAIAEALERYAAEPRGHVPIVRAPGDAPIVEPSTLDVTRRAAGEDAGAAPLALCAGVGLATGMRVLLPAWAVLFPWREPAPARPSTNGLAFGQTRGEAARRALLECIERDSMSRALCRLAAGRGEASPLVAGASLAGPAAAVLGRILAAGLHASLRDVTGELGVPTIHATIWEDMPDGGRRAHHGIACRGRAAAAAAAALLEAAQSRLVEIQGAREDFDEPSPAPVHPWFLDDGVTMGTTNPPNPGRGAPLPPDADDGLDALVAAVLRAGLREPCAVDLTPPDAPGSAVRVVAPDLEVCAIDPARAGPRALRWAREA